MSKLLRRSIQSQRRFRSNFAVATEEFAGTPAIKVTAPVAAQFRTSKLQSGIALASKATDSPVVGISVTVKAGSRDESAGQWGSAYMLKALAFQDTADRSAFTLLRDLQDVGARVSSDASRESVTFRVEVLRDQVEAAIAALADTVVHPYLPEWILKEHKPAAIINANTVLANPISLTTELAHEAAFGEATALGSSLYSASEIQALTHEHFVAFREKAFVADNVIISANGLDHGSLTSLAETYFTDVPAGRSVAFAGDYFGGEVRVKTAGAATHMALAFRGAAFGKPGYDAHEVLATLLRARLQRESATANAFNFGYKDTGLIGVYGSAANTSNASKVASTLASAIKSVASASEEEINRAKRSVSLQRTLANEQTVSTRALERSSVAGVDPVAFAECREVNKEAVQKAAQNLLQSKPAFVVLGPTGRVPRLQDITQLLK